MRRDVVASGSRSASSGLGETCRWEAWRSCHGAWAVSALEHGQLPARSWRRMKPHAVHDESPSRSRFAATWLQCLAERCAAFSSSASLRSPRRHGVETETEAASMMPQSISGAMDWRSEIGWRDRMVLRLGELVGSAIACSSQLAAKEGRIECAHIGGGVPTMCALGTLAPLCMHLRCDQRGAVPEKCAESRSKARWRGKESSACCHLASSPSLTANG